MLIIFFMKYRYYVRLIEFYKTDISILSVKDIIQLQTLLLIFVNHFLPVMGKFYIDRAM